MSSNQPSDLEGILDLLEGAARGRDEVSFGNVLAAAGRRSFGPLLLLAGLIILAPLVGDIPGVPTLTGALVLLISAQLLLGRPHFWLPGWMLERSVAAGKLRKGIEWMRRPARFVDRFVKSRLTRFVEGIWVRVVAVISAAIALLTPVMEFVPFSANGAGAVLSVLGLALIARDGLLVLLAIGLAAATAGLVAYGLAAA